MKIRMIALASALLALAACATATPYQPALTPGGEGYSAQRIEADRFRVAFSGNSLTELRTVETYLLFRAAELTLEQGADWFAVVDRDTQANRRVVGSGGFGPYGPYYRGFRHSYFHPRFGWHPWYDPFWDDVYLREITRYVASAEIRLGSGPRPAGDPRAYDARQVRANLAGQIQYPTQ